MNDKSEAVFNMLNVLQLYLCGLPGKKLEKLRRLVNAAGGLRFNQPSEELTHVVMGELDPDLKNFVFKVTHRSELQNTTLDNIYCLLSYDLI